MAGSDWRWVIGSVAAVAVPAAALHLLAGDDRHAAGLTAAPFGWPRVMVAHLLTAVPLGWLLADRARRAAGPDLSPGVGVVLGLALIGLVAVAGRWGAEVLAGAGYTPLLTLRTAVAVSLVLPWCVVASPPLDGPPSGRWPLAVAEALAVAPAGVYADLLLTARTVTAREQVNTGRAVRAVRTLTGVCELGGEEPVGGLAPAAALKRLRDEIPGLESAVAVPLPDGATPTARARRAVLLIRLDRLDEAAAALEPVAAADTDLRLLLAAVYRDQERWAESDATFKAALAELAPRAADPAARERCRDALAGLAYNARADRRPADAGRALQRGLELLPDQAAQFHFLLGEHYRDGGRPRPALDQFGEAARLDPKGYGAKSEAEIRDLRTQTYGCLLRPGQPGGSAPAAGQPASR